MERVLREDAFLTNMSTSCLGFSEVQAMTCVAGHVCWAALIGADTKDPRERWDQLSGR